MLIAITGTPGTGKTSSAKILGKDIDAEVIHLKRFVKVKRLSSGFDKKMKSEMVDLEKLRKELKKEMAKLETGNRKTIVEGHLACEIPLPADFVFVLRCNPRELEKRMRKRRYAMGKMRENLLAEMLDYCTQKAEANYPKAEIIEIETAGRNTEETAKIMASAIAGKKFAREKISYAKELKKFLELE